MSEIIDYTQNKIIDNDVTRSLSSEEMTQKETIFVWIDILGFSNRLEKNDEYVYLCNLLQKFQNKFINEPGLYDTCIISDGIVLELNPKREKWTLDNFKSCFLAIAQKQAEFIFENKCVVRGSFAVGSRYYSEESNKMFISNGLSRAYNLESKTISWPIIGTDIQNIKRIAILCNVGEEDVKNYFLHTKNTSDEDVWFIDFSKQLNASMNSNRQTPNDNEITNLIDDGCNNKALGVKMKYEWLRQYLDIEPLQNIFYSKAK